MVDEVTPGSLGIYFFHIDTAYYIYSQNFVEVYVVRQFGTLNIHQRFSRYVRKWNCWKKHSSRRY